MGKIFPFDRNEAMSRAEAARRKAEREAAIAERARRNKEEGEKAAARERELNVWYDKELAAEAEQERQKRVRDAIGRTPEEPQHKQRLNPDATILVRVRYQEKKFQTSETLRGMETLAAGFEKMIQRWRKTDPMSDGTDLLEICKASIETLVDLGVSTEAPPLPRRMKRGALAWFLLNNPRLMRVREDPPTHITIDYDEEGLRFHVHIFHEKGGAQEQETSAHPSTGHEDSPSTS
jgi:hypothetical protein